VHERLLAVIRDFVVDGETLVAFIRAYEEAVRIVKEGSSDFSSLSLAALDSVVITGR
jgi:hypothetical protein